MRWVVGFLFKNGGTEVALVMKNRPEWQRGKLNGIGGHIEANETASEAVRREFFEEAGADVVGWREYCVLRERGGDVHFFVAHGERALVSKTDEAVAWYPVAALTTLPVVANLSWLVPMALNENVMGAFVDYVQPQ